MIQISGLSARIAGRLLIDNASVTLPAGTKAGLVGRNGAGKSTLFRVITGELAAEAGSVSLPRNARIGQVAQEAPGTEEPLIEIVLKADRERTALVAEAETATDPHRIAEIQTRLADIGAHSAEARAASILAGLGFDHQAQKRPASSFSGGWRMKLTNAALFAGVALHTLAIGMNAPAEAQDAATRIDDLQPNIPADAKLLLTANELVYNRDTEKVTVRGNVQIEYGGYKMVARQVDYDQKSGRILATGDIQLIEPGGNIVYADRMDVTDDFGNGFVQALRIETTDLTRLAAETGERRNGEEFILNKAVYTA